MIATINGVRQNTESIKLFILNINVFNRKIFTKGFLEN